MTSDDKQLAHDLDIDMLDTEVQTQLIDEFYEALRIRLGITLESTLTDEQLLAFEAILKTADDAACQQWLETNITGYDTIVSDETSKLIQEIQASAQLIKQTVADTK